MIKEIRSNTHILKPYLSKVYSCYGTFPCELLMFFLDSKWNIKKQLNTYVFNLIMSPSILFSV